MNHETWTQIIKNDIIPAPMIRLKELHFKMQDKEYLSSSEKNLDEHFENELNHWWNHHVEPSWRTQVMKEWSNEKKEKLKAQGETL